MTNGNHFYEQALVLSKTSLIDIVGMQTSTLQSNILRRILMATKWSFINYCRTFYSLANLNVIYIYQQIKLKTFGFIFINLEYFLMNLASIGFFILTLSSSDFQNPKASLFCALNLFFYQCLNCLPLNCYPNLYFFELVFWKLRSLRLFLYFISSWSC